MEVRQIGIKGMVVRRMLHKYAQNRLLIFCICISAILAPMQVLADEYQRAVEAYNDNDFLTALRIFKKYATQGDVKAQRFLGEMYDKGRGVQQDYNNALYWYLRAAAQNDAHSQYRIGLKYANGHGVQKNDKHAYAWFAMAFDNGYEPAANPLKVLNKTMTSEERQHALKLALEQIKNLQ